MDYNVPILVTGGTGFVGSYLLRYLIANGYTNIRALKRANSPMDLVEEVKNNVEWLEGDVLDIFSLEDALKGVKQVYHCAAIVSYSPRDFKQMMKVNVEGTANIVNLSIEANIEKMVYVSSIAALGKTEKTLWVDEDADWIPSKNNSQYAISKYLAEMEVWRGMAEGLRAAIVNPSVILGSGFWEAGTANFFTKVYNGLKFYTPGATGFVDVRDVARFMVLLMESKVVEQRFILNAENWTFRELFTTIANHLNKKPPSIHANAFLRGLAWRLEWLRTTFSGARPIITRETARSASKTTFYKNDKSKTAFNFEYLPLEQTIRETAKQFLESFEKGERGTYLK